MWISFLGNRRTLEGARQRSEVISFMFLKNTSGGLSLAGRSINNSREKSDDGAKTFGTGPDFCCDHGSGLEGPERGGKGSLGPATPKGSSASISPLLSPPPPPHLRRPKGSGERELVE